MPNRFSSLRRGGYDPSEVDSYIETMEAVIKSYKEKDSAIKNAILNAQIAADGIILNAKNQAHEIRVAALAQVSEIKESIVIQTALLDEFQAEYNQMINKYIHIVNTHDIGDVKKKITALADYLNRFSDNDREEPLAKESVPEKILPAAKVTKEESSALLG